MPSVRLWPARAQGAATHCSPRFLRVSGTVNQRPLGATTVASSIRAASPMAPPRLLHRPARTRLGRRKRVTEEPQARRLGGRRARLSGSLKSNLQCERSHVQGWSHIPRLCHCLRLRSSGVRGHERRDKVSNPGEGPVWLRARLAICNCLKQLEHVNLQSRCRCWRGAPSPGADVAGASPVPVQMWQR